MDRDYRGVRRGRRGKRRHYDGGDDDDDGNDYDLSVPVPFKRRRCEPSSTVTPPDGPRPWEHRVFSGRPEQAVPHGDTRRIVLYRDIDFFYPNEGKSGNEALASWTQTVARKLDLGKRRSNPQGESGGLSPPYYGRACRADAGVGAASEDRAPGSLPATQASSSHTSVHSGHRDLSQTRHIDRGQTRHRDFGEARHRDHGETRHRDHGESRHRHHGETRHRDHGKTRHRDQGETRVRDLSPTRHRDRSQTRQTDHGATRLRDQGYTRLADQGERRHRDHSQPPDDQADTKRRDHSQTRDRGHWDARNRDDGRAGNKNLNQTRSKGFRGHRGRFQASRGGRGLTTRGRGQATRGRGHANTGGDPNQTRQTDHGATRLRDQGDTRLTDQGEWRHRDHSQPTDDQADTKCRDHSQTRDRGHWDARNRDDGRAGNKNLNQTRSKGFRGHRDRFQASRGGRGLTTRGRGQAARGRGQATRGRGQANTGGVQANTGGVQETESGRERRPKHKKPYNQFCICLQNDFSYNRRANDVCLFLAENLDHVTDYTREPHRSSQAGQLPLLLRLALVESTELCSQSKRQIVKHLVQTAFFESRLVIDLMKQLMRSAPDENDAKPIRDLLDILKVIAEHRQMDPLDMQLFVNALKGVLQAVSARCEAASADWQTVLLSDIEDIEAHFQRPGCQKEEKEETQTGTQKPVELDLETILPDISDIHLHQAVQIPARGYRDVFDSSSDYIRYTFLTFREDFLGPLCKAVLEYIDFARRQRDGMQVDEGDRLNERFRHQSVRLYQGVQVVDTALSTDVGVDITIRIDASRIRNFNSRLVFGSLVCLSDDDFRSMVYASVKDKNRGASRQEMLVNVSVIKCSKGSFRRQAGTTGSDLNLAERGTGTETLMETGARTETPMETEGEEAGSCPEKSPTSSDPAMDMAALRGRTFTMLESTAFYTAYLHPLESLQRMHHHVVDGHSSLPFEKQLLELSKNLAPPAYLRTSDGRMSFACMRKYAGNNPDTEGECKQEAYQKVSVTEVESWPHREDVGLDKAQYEALQHALTKQVALIQGPPGTGKTTLGVRLAELLLENERLWQGDDLDKAPLVLISYTNHALDQFLAELIKLPVLLYCPNDRIVRVGSRCENEKIASYSLNNLRKDYCRAVPRNRNVYTAAQRRLRDLRENREAIGAKIEEYKSGILHHETLRVKGAMSPAHFRSLVRRERAGREDTPAIVRWLQLHQDSCSMESVGVMDCAAQQTGQGFELAATYPIERPQGGHTGTIGEHNGHGDSCATAARVADGHGGEGSGQEVEGDDLTFEEDDARRLDLDDASDGEEGNSSAEEESCSKFKDAWRLFAPEMAVDRTDLSTSTDHPYCGDTPPQFRNWLLQKISAENNSNDVMTEEEERHVTDVWGLDVTQRWRLYRLWLTRVTERLMKRRQEEEKLFQTVSDRMLEHRNNLDLRIMRLARIVAMTTTAASRMTSVLRDLEPRIIIVEEAAEISEAHLLASLSSSCQHLILIGDHKQLRPSYNNYELTAKKGRHHIDISMFERLCSGGVPFKTLQLQHRMRPEIASLLVPTIYDSLQDHRDVRNYRHVKGVTRDLFFIDHPHPEDTPEDSHSKRNTHEAHFLAALYRYLRLQGYREKDITILATYKEQVMLLRNLVKEVEFNDPLIPRPEIEEEPPALRARGGPPRFQRPRGVRVTAVDNFQGEENRIILVSLVRSNANGSIGYLKEKNRVCVALSRAKEGLFVVGNCTMLAERSPDCWKPILDRAQGNQLLGPALPLTCPRHPGHVTMVASENDFQKRCQNGGCSQSCTYRRQCGHACKQQCHDPELFHHTPCTNPCVRKCPASGHACAEHPCYEKCPPCQYEMEMKMEKCGHTVKVKCHRRFKPPPCGVQCEKMLECGHRCQAKCGSPCTKDCNELVKVTCARKHEFQIACHKKDTPDCTVPCTATLECGHPCDGKCGKCLAGRLHQPCRKRCQRTLVCGHPCGQECTMSCPPCTKPCPARCVHSQCGAKCGEPCTPCAERCAWACGPRCPNNFRCSKLCSELCDRPRCNTQCDRKRRCAQCKRIYQCRFLLCERQGQRCDQVHPHACPICRSAELFDIFFGTEDEPDALFYQMPDCRCVLEVSGLDRYMDGRGGAEEEEGEVQEESPGPVSDKTCPKCKSPVLTALRYGNVLKTAYADMTLVKRKLLPSPEELDQKRRSLLQKVRQSRLSGHTFTEDRHDAEKAVRAARTLEQLTLYENRLNFLGAIDKLYTKLRHVNGSPATPEKSAARVLEKLREWTLVRRRRFSDQECEEFERELRRAEMAVLLAVALTGLVKQRQEASEAYTEKQKWFRRLMDDPEVLSAEEEAGVRRLVRGGLGISDEERLMIVKTMGFKPGHWYKCPNGHVYAIGECGGAMQRSRCPECQAEIGGAQHRLTEGNAVATEMDGSGYGAWSEQANMANYVMFD